MGNPLSNPLIGDVVRLQSGGPDMTITCVSEDKTVTVRWFTVGETHCHRDMFPANALKDMDSV